MPLISLDEYNATRGLEVEALYDAPNGIACPKCGAELHDDRQPPPNSAPPQIYARCPDCGFMGSRILSR
jgi:hypothetical protein